MQNSKQCAIIPAWACGGAVSRNGGFGRPMASILGIANEIEFSALCDGTRALRSQQTTDTDRLQGKQAGRQHCCRAASGRGGTRRDSPSRLSRAGGAQRLQPVPSLSP